MLNEAQYISRLSPLRPTTSMTPVSACGRLPATAPSVSSFSPIARSGSVTFDPTAVSTAAIERGISARIEISTMTTRRAALCASDLGEARCLQRVHLGVAPVRPTCQLVVGAVFDDLPTLRRR